ncbi:MAG: hypothetical protein ACLTAF_13750 [Blautia coccoides]
MNQNRSFYQTEVSFIFPTDFRRQRPGIYLAVLDICVILRQQELVEEERRLRDYTRNLSQDAGAVWDTFCQQPDLFSQIYAVFMREETRGSAGLNRFSPAEDRSREQKGVYLIRCQQSDRRACCRI